ncbi:hypothetical protein A5773_04260 [Mycobacterium sp. 852014-52450_SCH5900713]|uniref:hypothetical protein n=1 Tax=Mycobacterium sp. 852014-52450_SCH5900713 TaxID=1834116 RepID=UPI000801270A|nr:hypothetical protein [Mycobacterium sp. 852014-52450_SCH5900713]OBG00708.1 hypothetical protein A5773_04260 [Mycobacterium sp. 852014-52450_SCH5900713]
MDILSEEQYAVLGFIAACNRSGYSPKAAEVTLWRKRPIPAPAEYRTFQRGPISSLGALGQVSALTRMIDTTYSQYVRSFAKLAGVFYDEGTSRELIKAAESVIDHLVYLGWLEKVTDSGEDSRLRLTDIGNALLRDREREAATEDDVSVVVLGNGDPLAYPLMVGQLANAGAGYLVDPYLKLDVLHMVVMNTHLTRVLVSPKTGKGVLPAMRTYLDSPSLARRVELRESGGLHDRYVFAEDKSAFMLGTSLNGVGKTTTVLVPIPSPARETLRDTYERLWEEATLIGPRPVSDEEEESDADDGGSEERQEPQ